MALAISVIVPMIGWECLDALSDDEVNAVLDSSPSALDGPSGLRTHQKALQGIDSSRAVTSASRRDGTKNPFDPPQAYRRGTMLTKSHVVDGAASVQVIL